MMEYSPTSGNSRTYPEDWVSPGTRTNELGCSTPEDRSIGPVLSTISPPGATSSATQRVPCGEATRTSASPTAFRATSISKVSRRILSCGTLTDSMREAVLVVLRDGSTLTLGRWARPEPPEAQHPTSVTTDVATTKAAATRAEFLTVPPTVWMCRVDSAFPGRRSRGVLFRVRSCLESM